MRWPLIAVLAATAAAQPTKVVSTTQIAADGQSFSLPQFTGDWFATPADAHLSVRLSSAAARLDLSLDGRTPTQVINAENDSDLGGAHVGFFWHSPGHDVKPRGADAVTVRVTHMDDRDFEGQLSGSAGGVKLAGTIHLHREAAPAPKLSGTYVNCDNVIRDKYVMAENRSASDCEVKFDHAVREAFDQAFRPVAQYLQQHEWLVVKQSKVETIDAVARRTELAPYRMDFTHVGAFAMEFGLGGAAAAQYQQRMNAITQKIADEIRAGKQGASMREVQSFAHEMQGATRFRLSGVINMPSFSMASFGGGHTLLQVPGAAFAAAVSHAQASTGGGADASMDQSVILFGNWSAPAFRPDSDGGEQIAAMPVLNNSAPLTVQNIVIRIQANPANAQQAISKIDWAPLSRLLHAPAR